MIIDCKCIECGIILTEENLYRHRDNKGIRPKKKKLLLCINCAKERRQSQVIKSKYGVDALDYNNLFNEQNGRCAICNRHQSEMKNKLSVDHNHTTGAVRALLCNKCNSALGLFQDSPEILDKAKLYLLQYDI